jgi:IclR family pca regulon transcriptional regulator
MPPASSAPPPATASPGLQRRDWIAGLEKGLDVIACFDADHSRLNASEVAQRCGITRTAARRYLLTLQHLGFISGDGRLYWLTPRVLRLGQAYLESARLPRVVQPYLQRVTGGTQENAYVSVLDGNDIVFIARNGSNRAMNIGYVLGARVKAEVTAAGLLLLSMRDPQWQQDWLATHQLSTFTPHTIDSKERLLQEMARVRSQGWALSEQQLDLNYRGIAVPLRDRHGQVQAALSVSMPMGHESAEEAVRRVLAVLNETAQAMRDLV